MDAAENPIQRFKRDRDLTYEQLAELWDLTPDYLRKLGAGMRPGAKTARKIEEKSDGAISAAELVFGDCDATEPAA